MLGAGWLVGGRSQLILIQCQFRALVNETGDWFKGYIHGTGQWQGQVGLVRNLIGILWKQI